MVVMVAMVCAMSLASTFSKHSVLMVVLVVSGDRSIFFGLAVRIGSEKNNAIGRVVVIM